MTINGECGLFSPKILESFRHARQYMERIADAGKEVSNIKNR